MTLVQRHRAIMNELKDEINKVHAVDIQTKIP